MALAQSFEFITTRSDDYAELDERWQARSGPAGNTGGRYVSRAMLSAQLGLKPFTRQPATHASLPTHR